jgi:hypothetical protein
LYTRLKIAIAGKACKKLPAYGRKKACYPAGLRPVIKTVIFLQGCRARLPGKSAGQGCRAMLPGRAAGQGCQARRRARLPSKAAGQGCRARLHGKGAICTIAPLSWQVTVLQWQDTKLQWQDTKLQWQDTKLQWQDTKLQWQDTKLQWQDTKMQWQDTKRQWQDTKLYACTQFDVSPTTRTTTTKQDLDPHCTYVHAGNFCLTMRCGGVVVSGNLQSRSASTNNYMYAVSMQSVFRQYARVIQTVYRQCAGNTAV